MADPEGAAPSRRLPVPPSELLRAFPGALLRPRAFFIAWGGVPTLAFSGWPPAVIEFKARLSELLPDLPTESPGSLWPKITLGAPATARALELSELRRLLEAANRAGSNFSANSSPVNLDRLSAVLFARRNLEVQLARTDYPSDGTPDEREPETSELQRVEDILKDFHVDSLLSYQAALSKAPVSIERYREPVVGATLAHFPAEPPVEVSEFRQLVDAALPGRFIWFEESSLHMTLRSLA